jgi:hypothetical protein
MSNKTLYQIEYAICPGSNYCESGIIEIKKRMITKLIRDIPFKDLEKIFNITSEKNIEGETFNIEIKL